MFNLIKLAGVFYLGWYLGKNNLLSSDQISTGVTNTKAAVLPVVQAAATAAATQAESLIGMT